MADENHAPESSHQPPPPPPPLAVAAVLLFAEDPDALARFYRQELGVPLQRVAVADLHPHWACDIGHVYLSIWPLAAAELEAAEGPGRAGLALYLRDLEPRFQRLSSLPGVEVIFPPRRTRLGTIARLRDPGGNVLELYHP